MKRILPLLLALSLLLSAALSAAEEVPATPTDLDCPHEHIREVFYFDSPGYLPLDNETHMVYGSAVVETMCEDCGKVLSSEYRADAEETRRHTFKKGACVLCGAKEPENPVSPEDTTSSKDLPGEATVVPMPEKEGDPRNVVVLTEEDLTAWEEMEITTLVIRPENGSAAIALPVTPIREEMEDRNVPLRAEMETGEDGVLRASLTFEDPDTDEAPQSEGISLRFYLDYAPEKLVAFQPEDPAAEKTEFPAAWIETQQLSLSYWSLPWQGNGLYTPVQ